MLDRAALLDARRCEQVRWEGPTCSYRAAPCSLGGGAPCIPRPPRIRAIEHRGLRGSIRHGTVPLTFTIATHCHRILKRYFPGPVQGWWIMSGHIPRPVGSIALVATLLASGVGIGVPANIARADHCLSAPNSLARRGATGTTNWIGQLSASAGTCARSASRRNGRQRRRHWRGSRQCIRCQLRPGQHLPLLSEAHRKEIPRRH